MITNEYVRAIMAMDGDQKSREIFRLENMMERQYAEQLSQPENTRVGAVFMNAYRELIENNNIKYFSALKNFKTIPVTIDEFIESNEFLGDKVSVWDELRPDLRASNPDTFTGEQPIHEVLMSGATGTGKTVCSTITCAYQLYLQLLAKNPHQLFGLMQSTPIVNVFMSVRQRIADRVIYRPFRNLFLDMEWTRRNVIYDTAKESELFFPDKNVLVIPVNAVVESILGQAIIGGIIDELNFMEVTAESKKIAGSRGNGGRFDQAEEIYNQASRRRRRSFKTRGVSIGTLCVISSVRYKGDFMARRVKTLQDIPEPNVIAFNHKQYEVQPQENFCGDKFRLLIGNDKHPTKVLEENEIAGTHYPINSTVEEVPVEYRTDFLKDPENALRDIIGMATDSISAFIGKRNKLIDMFERGEEKGLKSIVHKQNVILSEEGMPTINEDNLPSEADRVDHCRFVHVDLSISGDSCGIAMVKHTGFANKISANDPDTIERLPTFDCELAVSIKPDKLNHIDISEIRKWILRLINKYGYNIYYVTYDGFQSYESVQMFNKAGVRSKNISMDKTIEPYMAYRDIIYQDRIDSVPNELLQYELQTLEHLEIKGKIDHPPKGSKDIADAVCGAIYAAMTSRAIRSQTHAVDEDGIRVATVSRGSTRQRGRTQRKSRPRR